MTVLLGAGWWPPLDRAAGEDSAGARLYAAGWRRAAANDELGGHGHPGLIRIVSLQASGGPGDGQPRRRGTMLALVSPGIPHDGGRQGGEDVVLTDGLYEAGAP